MKNLQDIKKQYLQDMQKNQYYNNIDELEQAWGMACSFYKKEYQPTLLKSGNHKLNKNIIIWDIPEIVTCKGACPSCYALKASRIYKNTRIMRACHYAMLLQALNNNKKYNYLLNYMSCEIKKHVLIYKNPILRLHGAGDIFSGDYLQFILDIVTENKNIKIYTYSKQLDNKIIDIINNKYENFNIIKSMPCVNNKYYLNYGNMEYLQDLKNKLQKDKQACFICSYGIDKNITCGVNCMACLNCDNVLFLKH